MILAPLWILPLVEVCKGSFVRPVKSPLGCAIIVSNERQDAGAQLLHRAATESGKQATHEEREPDLNLVEPGAMPWGVDEANAMAGIGEKGSARVHAGEMAAFVFDAQFLLDATLRSHQRHQRFRLMGVELISEKDPGSVRISLESLVDVSSEVGFGARGSNAGRHDFPGGHIQIGDQTLGAMPLIFKFLPLDVTGLHGQAGVQTFKCLDTSHLISAHHMCSLLGEHWRGPIDLTDCADLLG
jgi:hypothetical protein